MKLQRPDQRASTYIKTQETKPALVVNQKTKYPQDEHGEFGSISRRWTRKHNQIYQRYVRTKESNDMENKLIGTENTRLKTCNMMHVERWHERICQFCATQEKPLFGRNFSRSYSRNIKDIQTNERLVMSWAPAAM
ncbi:hypothetical protein ACS0TY_030772 [Phlomoides rotata]